jgi:hypothetical protein
MDSSEFITVASFEEIISNAKSIILSSEDYKLNFSLKVRFDINLVKEPQFLDIVDLAKDFQNPNKPSHMYINHGEYITEQGISHMINELKSKHVGNRAIISLISQEHIIGSGDKPIPSFMILQFSLEWNDLYVTTYFRALEVEKFLRINVEEIRLVIQQIHRSIRRVKFVNLHIFAFRAYLNKDINPMLRPSIENLDRIEILKLMEKNTRELARLLKEKLSNSTVVEDYAIGVINEIITNSKMNQDIMPCFKTENVKKKVYSCLESCRKLSSLRATASNSKEVDDANTEYLGCLKSLIGDIENC